MWRIIKLGLALCLGLTLLLAGSGYAYVHSLDLDNQPAANPRTGPAGLAFVRDGAGAVAVFEALRHAGCPAMVGRPAGLLPIPQWAL